MNDADALTLVNSECDWMLQTLVHSANVGVEIGVTLTTAAGIVTGTIIGGAKYMDQQKALLAERWGTDELRSSFDDIFTAWRERYVQKDDGEEPSAPIYIHLSSAKLLTHGQFVPSDPGMLWRGKINEVIGFSIGILSRN
ncbi:hypothetical protein [Stutzerimonas stutzeri]|uniref:hypothetical protein n=1 Tax=Stutzerimonas stutzeri TaxID=316 RepID=UPI00035CA09C|nr:hypothetical protein [Stutzerimonas stutzeri]